jgi:predicted acetyltransferase
MPNLILVKPNETHLDELKAYVQEFRDAGDEIHGASTIHEATCLHEWLKKCHANENEDTKTNPKYVTGEQFLLMEEGDTRILGTIALRREDACPRPRKVPRTGD